MINQNSRASHAASLDNLAAVATTDPSTVNTSPGMPQPDATIETAQVEFTGLGSEYFRIWIVNLLLILVTFGIYIPWAKVRKLKYFYNNTHLDGHSLDFHGNPKQMLRGTLIAGAFFALYSIAADFSAAAAWIAGLVFIAIWPPIYRSALRFRLANTSWRGMRFRLHNAPLKEAYLSIGIPNALLLIPLLMISTASADNEVKKAVLSDTETAMFFAGFILFIVTLPYFLWRIYRYQISHSAWGPLQMQFRSSAAAMYTLFFKALGMVLLLIVAAGALIALFSPSLFGSGRPSLAWFLAILPLVMVFFVLMNILPKAYMSAALQNLVWSRTGNNWVRFKSEISIWRYMLLQLKNYVLILITLGLYWPFAVIASRRRQLEAVSLKSRVELEKLSDAARAREKDAVGDMAADLFDMDFGL